MGLGICIQLWYIMVYWDAVSLNVDNFTIVWILFTLARSCGPLYYRAMEAALLPH
jgi:hypothetical protein